MRKEKVKPEPWGKKFLTPILISAIGIPTAGLIWSKANWVWGAQEKVKTIEEAVIQQTNTQSEISKSVQAQEKRNDLQDEELKNQRTVTQLQVDSLKELLKEIRKK